MGRKKAPTLEERAYKVWEDEGRPEGHALEHWLRAEADAAPKRKPSRRPSRADEEIAVAAAKPRKVRGTGRSRSAKRA